MVILAVFDNDSPSWVNEPTYNQMFLRCQQNYLNTLLRSRGHVFLNEVFDVLGIKRTPDGAIMGWIYNKDHHSNINFGSCTANPNGSIMLELNVDGVMYHQI